MEDLDWTVTQRVAPSLACPTGATNFPGSSEPDCKGLGAMSGNDIHEKQAGTTRVVVDSALGAFIILDRAGTIGDWSPEAGRIFGWPLGDVVGKSLASTLLPTRYREAWEQRLQDYREGIEGALVDQRIEMTAVRRDGAEFPVELTVFPTTMTRNLVFNIFVRNIAMKKKKEQHWAFQSAVTRILAEETTVQNILTNLLQTYCECEGWDVGLFWAWDPSSRTLRSVAEWQSQPLKSKVFIAGCQGLILQEGQDLPGRVRAQGGPVWISDVTQDEEFFRPQVAAEAGLRSAFAYPVQVGDTPHGVMEFFSHQDNEPDHTLLNVVTDIGNKVGQFIQRKEAEAALQETEAQLRQSHKMEAMGRLAGGIAHDFNNLLTVINGYSQLLLGQVTGHGPVRSEIEEIKKAGIRASALTSQLLAFSRRQAIMPQLLDLNTVVNNMEGMLKRLLGEDSIELVTVLDPTIGMVKADPGQLDQIVMNLAVNSRDAMPQGGRVWIETKNVTVESGQSRPLNSMKHGPHVLLTITDTGCGIDEKTLVHIFEPFFTTKAKGEGTGLGLATVYGIVKQNQAHITVESTVGKGTTFSLYFPESNLSIEADASVDEAGEKCKMGETVLVLEDEPGVRGLVRTMLKEQGYTVLEARDGIHAHLVSKAHFGTIDLLLTDVVMPQKSGPEAAKELLSDRPGMKVLYMSGYPDHPAFSKGPLHKGKLFLQKPFTTESLTRRIREVLDMPSDDFKSLHVLK